MFVFPVFNNGLTKFYLKQKRAALQSKRLRAEPITYYPVGGFSLSGIFFSLS